MKSILTDYLDKEIKLSKKDGVTLPLYHNCSQDDFFKFLNQWRIDAPDKFCNVFNKKRIVYTFYGASKFVINDPFPTVSEGDLIYCVILDPIHCKPVFQIFPFDSGAVSGKNPKIRPALIDWEKLNLGMNVERINKLILMCYLDLDKYLDNAITFKDAAKSQIVAKLPEPDMVSHVGDLHKLMLDPNIADERRLCYEVHFENALDITLENIQGFIVPTQALKKKSFQEILKKVKLTEKNVEFYPASCKTKQAMGEFINARSKKITRKVL